MKNSKRIILFVTAIITILLLCSSVSTYAADTIPSGYIGIYNAKDLVAINEDLSGKYILMNDIDLSTYGDWTPLGDTAEFSGVFDGNGHYIKNMKISDETVDDVGLAGLFSTLQGATIRNVRVGGVIECDETSVLIVGAIAGQASDSTIFQCASYVTISYRYGEPNGDYYTSAYDLGLDAGGIVGYTLGNTKIEECYNTGKISGTATGAPLYIGGIVGLASDNSIVIENCYNMADIVGNTGYVDVNIGGIAGDLSCLTKSSIKNCYNIGQVLGTNGKWKFDGNNVGGILGSCANDDRTTIKNCYFNSAAPAAVGSVRIWSNEGYDIDVYVDAKDCDYSEMQKKATYLGFDFDKVWKAGTSTFLFPTLRWNNGGNSSCSHAYNSTGGNICTVCGYEFEHELVEYNKTMYAAIDNTAVRSQPYAKAGTLVDKLSKGEAVKVTHYFYNALGSKWYVLQDGNYVYSERLTATGTKKYTLTFNANGSGVTNLPEAAHIQEGVRMAIPGKISGVPIRAGYTFVGYSTDKNATTAQYVPGRGIKLTEDTTLYAIWHKKASSLDNLSSETIEALSKSVGIQQPKGSGKCTKSATATLLKRRQIATGNAGTFSLNDIEKGAGYSAINPGSNTYKSNGNTYTCTAIQPKQINTDPTKYIIELLDEHPEGIVIYCDYYNLYAKKPSQHAVVISDYEIDENGNYHFYAYDPGMSNTKRMRFEETTLYKGCNSAEHSEYMKVTSYPSYANVFSNFKSKNCGCIWYVETES